MMSRLAAARFTPSLHDHQTLEALFVARTALLTLATGKIADAATGRGLSHLLFVGPRGAGKTHLISLINYRAKQLPGFGTVFSLAWVPEDPWTIDSFDDLVKAITQSLDPPPPPHPEPINQLRQAQQRGPVVVLAENFDQILDQIGGSGQRALRAAIENERSMLFIATSTRLSRDLRNQAVPFYGFFDEIQLEPFSVDDAVTMLQQLAQANGDTALAEKLGTTESRAKLAAIEHLAGGQPRVWALLGNGLTIEGLDDLIATMVESFDDLTPYYQEQLARLSRNERRVIKALSDADHSLNVKSAATLTGIEQRSLSRTLTDLRRRGWVRPRVGYLTGFVDKRMTYYDLAEPLVRIAFQIKEQRAQPIGLIVNFVTSWYEVSELERLAVWPLPKITTNLEAASVQLAKVLTKNFFEGPVDASDAFRRFLDNFPGDDELAILEQCDDALAQLQHNADATLLLELPAGVSALLESHFADHPDISHDQAAARIRLSLGWLFVRTEGFLTNWRARGQDAFQDGAIDNPNMVPLFLAEAAAGRPTAATAVLRTMCENLGDRRTAMEQCVVSRVPDPEMIRMMDRLAEARKEPRPRSKELKAAIKEAEQHLKAIRAYGEKIAAHEEAIRQLTSSIWIGNLKIMIFGIRVGFTAINLGRADFDHAIALMLSHWSDDPIVTDTINAMLSNLQQRFKQIDNEVT